MEEMHESRQQLKTSDVSTGTVAVDIDTQSKQKELQMRQVSASNDCLSTQERIDSEHGHPGIVIMNLYVHLNVVSQ